jgi:MFS family permease
MEDENSPLLRRHSSHVYVEPIDENSIPAEYLVRFNPTGDSDNPRDWPRAYKSFIVFLLAFMAFTVTFTCISVVPVANDIVYDLSAGHASKSSSVLLVTIWELGEAAGPLFIAPFSEIFGRLPLIHAANCLFITATILAALSESVPLFIASRALTGLAVASNVLNPAIVGDIFASEERGGAMSLIMLAPLTGGAVGPAVAGLVAEKLGWRYVLWISASLAVACEILFLVCFRETYEVTILKKRAARRRKEMENESLQCIYDNGAGGDATSFKKLGSAVLRPFLVLYDSAILQSLSLFGSISFSYFYVMSTTLSDILEDIYHLSPALRGVSFMSFSESLASMKKGAKTNLNNRHWVCNGSRHLQAFP